MPHTCSLSGDKGRGNQAGRRRRYSSCSSWCCFCSSSSSCSLFSCFCSCSPSLFFSSPVSQTPPLPLQPFTHRPSETFYIKLMYWASIALYFPHLYPSHEHQMSAQSEAGYRAWCFVLTPYSWLFLSFMEEHPEVKFPQSAPSLPLHSPSVNHTNIGGGHLEVCGYRAQHTISTPGLLQ